MFKFILPTILTGVSIAVFSVASIPFYREISAMKGQIAAYNQALDNSKVLEAERDKLTQKYNSMSPENISRLEKLIPNSVDNIRLILEIEKLASPYGMVLKDVKYNILPVPDSSAGVNGGRIGRPGLGKDYNAWELEFSAQGTYSNFVSFLKDLENNLRVLDIAAVQFTSSSSGPQLNPSVNTAYKYNFKIKTYWLKN